MTETEKVKLKIHEYSERSSCLLDVHEVLRCVDAHLTIRNASVFPSSAHQIADDERPLILEEKTHFLAMTYVRYANNFHEIPKYRPI